MNPQSSGATPAGTTDEQSAGRAVQSMFNQIAPRYDLLNHLLSANVDRLWWRRTARTFAGVLRNPEAIVLDMCCGTGDMTLALLRLRPPVGKSVLALDFAQAMLSRAQEKFSRLHFSPEQVVTIEADALRMPFADNSIHLITTAFGFRNLANYSTGLREMHRVLRPGGEIGILDFSQPDGPIGRIYQFYFRHVLPRIGRTVSRQTTQTGEAPYSYLPQSVERFPKPQEMVSLMQSCGFTDASWTPYTLGIAGLYRAVKP